jgi:PIN domain nuclease of toxin-antitoxin system
VILLDTHAWLWWVSDPTQLSRKANSAIGDAEAIGVSAISCFEVATAIAKGRIVLDRPPQDWVEQALSLPRVELLALTPRIALHAAMLGAFHGDPADRLIVATAIIHSAVVVTKDSRIQKYGAIEALW